MEADKMIAVCVAYSNEEAFYVRDKPIRHRETERQSDEWQTRPASSRNDAIMVKCEECGRSTGFPPVLRGRTAECPSCAANLDVQAPMAKSRGEHRHN